MQKQKKKKELMANLEISFTWRELFIALKASGWEQYLPSDVESFAEFLRDDEDIDADIDHVAIVFPTMGVEDDGDGDDDDEEEDEEDEDPSPPTVKELEEVFLLQQKT